MTWLLIVLCFVLLAGGIIFSVLPPLPGPVLSFLGFLAAHYSSPDNSFSSWTIGIFLVLVLIILVADYTIPVLATKKFGGTKAGVWGGVIGTIAGVILPIPFGIVLGPLLGAVIGDLIGGNHIKAAFRSGFASFLGFLVATGLKVILSLIIGITTLVKVGSYAWTQVFG